MGSTGTGRFTDYTNYEDQRKASIGGNTVGGSSGDDRCLRAFSTNLEDVGRSDYFKKNQILPSKGVSIKIIHNERLQAIDIESNLAIGNLPTAYNYLLACMKDKFIYSGVIYDSSLTPIPSITVDITPYNE